MSEELVVIFWNPNELFKTSTTLHVVKGKINPAALMKSRTDGLSITEFFKSRGISVRKVMDTFPGSIVPAEERSADLNWDMPLMRQQLPQNQKGLQKLANMIGMPVVTFVYSRYHDQVPRKQFHLKPAV